jgi:putative addiction module CopG family antidote
MDLSLTPEFERFVQGKIALGFYRTKEEVLQAAFTALDAQEETLTAIAEGYADFQAGRYCSLEDSDVDFQRGRCSH